jgi:hypothetical protein
VPPTPPSAPPEQPAATPPASAQTNSTLVVILIFVGAALILGALWLTSRPRKPSDPAGGSEDRKRES